MTNVARIGWWVLSVMVAGTLLSAQGTPSATDAWVAVPAAGATATDAYAVVENPTMYEFFVVKVSADAAGAAEIVEGGADSAKTVRELSVPSYGRTELKPGALRIRLKDLKTPLKPGDSVALTLTTDGGVVIKVAAPVK